MTTLNTEVASKAAAYGLPGVAVDGNDVVAVWAAMRQATARARARRGPDADRGEDLPHRRPSRGRPGDRLLPHAGGSRRLGDTLPRRYMPAPSRRRVRLLPSRALAAIEQRVDGVVSDALEFARNSPEPDPATVGRHVLAEPINPRAARHARVHRLDRHNRLARRRPRRDRRGDAPEPAHPLFRRRDRRTRRHLRAHQGPLAGVRRRPHGRHADLRAGLYRRRDRRLGHRHAHRSPT